MKHTAELKELFTALTAAKGGFKPILKDKTGQAGQAKFKYATLDSIVEATEGALTANGLHIQQHLDLADGQQVLCTWLCHTSGQWICGSAPVYGDVNDPKKVGAYITYVARYAMCRILGIVTEEDTDVMAFEGQSAKKSECRTPIKAAVRPKVSGGMTELELMVAKESDVNTEHLESYVFGLAEKKGVAAQDIINSAMTPELFSRFNAGYAKAVERLTAQAL